RIARDGPMPFADFMRAALLDPEHGYYTRAPDIGPEGDFSTSARFEAFGFAVARFLDACATALGRDELSVLELGGGTGELAKHMGTHLKTRVRYAFDDASPRLLARQQGNRAPGAADSASDVVFGNEVLDALPVHRLVGAANGETLEVHVALDARREFRERLLPLSRADLATHVRPAKGQVVEVRPELDAFVATAAGRLGARGYLLFIDYGDVAERLFDPSDKWNGTLAAYRAHQKVADVYDAVGEQDLTADVDFSALDRAARAAGLRPAGFATQGAWLLALGIERFPGDENEVAMLTDAARLGSAFRVAAFAKGDAPTPAPGC
ncbi:MAG: SAM-dependent methyltransferase, partial [Thermoplasmatota archaeon]